MVTVFVPLWFQPPGNETCETKFTARTADSEGGGAYWLVWCFAPEPPSPNWNLEFTVSELELEMSSKLLKEERRHTRKTKPKQKNMRRGMPSRRSTGESSAP